VINMKVDDYYTVKEDACGTCRFFDHGFCGFHDISTFSSDSICEYFEAMKPPE
jgi:hypothetical protein